MKMNNVEQFILAEADYFHPMLERAQQSTLEQRENWRRETIRERQERMSLEVFDLLQGTVKYGPFKGLHLDRDTWWGKLDLGSQCLGLYEKEILNLIEATEAGRFSTFIDIGAADGYYAIGMLVSGKIGKTICFEQTEKGRAVIAENWKKNHSVGELTILGEANAASFASLRAQDLDNALVLIDIEGFEFELLTDEVLNLLKSCTVIIEIHHWMDDFLAKYNAFLRNAAHYFDIETVQRVERETSNLPELRDFTDDNRLLLTSERRPGMMRFLKLTPKAQ
ncbi:hypothetical protein Y71_08805 [Kosakonia radicincitans DSM 16656]|nr:hypothetical protein Y71_08805 [Kosakonia radicincitans DSM 16656]SKC20409.1 Methyltransferase FkbM domain-containing protein [Kosakonia radicincitans]VVT52597.1 hypothetical protein UYSO10_4128 [Kosakonia radicincitans]